MEYVVYVIEHIMNGQENILLKRISAWDVSSQTKKTRHI